MAVRQLVWKLLLISLTLAQVAASLLLPRGTTLTIVSDLIQGALLLIATISFLPWTFPSDSKAAHTRLFWTLMTAGIALWLAYQAMWNYFEVIRRQDVPDPFVGDIVLFLHLVPMIAALALLPHLREDERDVRIRMFDFLLLFTWWLFVYVYLVIPWQMISIDEPTYSTNFNLAYMVEKIVLLGGLALLATSAQGGWRRLYGHLLGGSALYASSSYVANFAIGHKMYYSGSIYDIPLTASIAWIAAIPSLAERFDLTESNSEKPVLDLWITHLSMFALLSLPWVALRSEIDSALPVRVKTFRITVTLATTMVMGVMVFWRQRLLGAEFSVLLDKSRRSLEELKALQRQLIQSEKMASLGRLVGGAAHELNNPLTAMLGYSDLLSASSLPAGEQQQAASIGEQVRRTRSLVASLLTFARPSPLRMIPLDLNSVLQTGLRPLTPRLETQGISIHLQFESPLPPVVADSNQILHVCLHLASQIAAQIESGTHSAMYVRTHHRDISVLVDFFADTPFQGPPSFDILLNTEGGKRPSTLSLSACCRIVEEHGGSLAQPSDNTIPAFRMELPVASRSAVPPARTAAKVAT
ncbi:MAG: histidine kinase dimerization/phospho-acceptor domain-containing protein [Terriglobales bacterium]